jgi:superfamily II DNA or RNA helicase
VNVVGNVTLRDYQRRQVDAATAALFGSANAPAKRSALIESATGTGKTTTIGAFLVESFEAGRVRRALVMAHRRELIDQAAERVRSMGLEVSNNIRSGARVIVASVAAVVRAIAKGRLSPDAFDAIVIDEAHHAPADSYQRVLSFFSLARILGVTATPDRADAKPLGFDVVADRYGIDRAIPDGYLAPIHGIRVEVAGMDLSRVRQRSQRADERRPTVPHVGASDTIDLLAAGAQARIDEQGERYSIELDQKDLGLAVTQPEAVDGVVTPLLELAATRRTMVFAVTSAHAKALTDAINTRCPNAARFVDYKTKPRARAATIEAFKRGEFQFLVNVLLLTEGFDCPAVECVAMVRPTMSRVIYAQIAGRVLRLFPGKTYGLFLDFAGVSCAHDLVGPEILGPALHKYEERKVAKKAAKPWRDETPFVPPMGIVPAPRPMTFTTRVVALLRGAGRVVAAPFEYTGRATVATVKGVAATGRGARSFWDWLTGKKDSM